MSDPKEVVERLETRIEWATDTAQPISLEAQLLIDALALITSQAEQLRIAEAGYAAARVGWARDIYRISALETELSAAREQLRELQLNSYDHVKPYMICIPTDTWRSVFALPPLPGIEIPE